VLAGPLGVGSQDLTTAPADITVHGVDAGDELGVGVGVGDADADGLDDLVLGAAEADGPGNLRSSSGELVILRGPVASGIHDLAVAPADTTIFGESAQDRLGRFISSGDVNGDGIDDIGATAYTARGFSNNQLSVGEIYVFTTLSVPSVELSTPDPSASETGPDPGEFLVSRSGTEGNLNVSYSVGGSATNGTDYVALTGSVSIPAGSSSAPISVVPIDDEDPEVNETVVVTILPGPGYAVGTNSQGTVTIADDDGASGACTITGTPGNDSLVGTNGDDVICGLGGDDTIDGRGGNDTLYGDEGNDVIRGGAGNDALFGGAGRDRLQGGLGTDAMFGEAGSDQLDGVDQVSGNDSLDGGPDPDQCQGDAGDSVTACP
jgi:Ca2+-binding RTX toxin-like protein